MSEPQDRAHLRARIDVVSSKAAAAFDDAVAAVEPLLDHEALAQWVDLGCAIATGSAVAAVKYFRESPSLIERLAPERRATVLGTSRAIAWSEPNVALEVLRHSAPLVEQWDDAGIEQWARVAGEIASQDYDAAIEYVRESPALGGVIPTESLSLWGELGVLLSREDRTVKDFLALSYFRSSAEWLRAIPDPSLRPLVLALGCRVAGSRFSSNAPRRPGQVALDVLQYAHTLLASLPSSETRHALLTAGIRVAAAAPVLLEAFLRHAPEVIGLVEGSVPRFEEWTNEGLGLADTQRERAEAYFSLRSKQAVEVAQRLSRGVFLRDVNATLTYVAEALCGRPVEIKAGSGASSALTERGGLITLPEKITVYPTPADNLRFYRVLAFHEAGHLEFGTYAPLPPEAAQWFGVPAPADQTEAASLLGRFPDAELAQNLWTIVEEARIDFLLRHHYPGLGRDMDLVLFEQLKSRPKIETLPRRSAILEALLQLSVADEADVPLPILEAVTSAYDVIKRVRRPDATVGDVLRAVVDLYPLVAEGFAEPSSPSSRVESPPLRSEFDELAMGHAPIGSFAFRDTLQSPQLRMGQHGAQQGRKPPQVSRDAEAVERPESRPVRREPEDAGGTVVAAGDGTGVFWYDEWDHLAQEYRRRWCRLEQRPADAVSADEMEALFAGNRGIEASLRRYFAAIKPEAFRKAIRQPDGDEIDLDAAIAATVDRRARLTPSDRLYVRREKRIRDVATALLIDTSGSTGRQISTTGARVRRIIDVEREALALLGSALDALGDQFALYAFSGQSRHGVACRVLKGFDEAFGPVALSRIGALTPSGQNRDGAAIRHVGNRLRARDAAVKLLILVSDGRPLDDEYAGDYALEDTRAALRELRAAGIHPFCVTIDDAADRYIERLHGDVQYTVIRDVATLPERLPRLYKRLTT